MKRVRAAVIGCGAIGHHCHIPGYVNNKYADLVAVADPSDKNRKSAMEKFGIEHGYKKAEDLYANHEIDCVSIGTPNAFHAEHCILALKHNLHVLCEKPLCMNLKEAKQVKRAWEKVQTIFMTAFTHRLYTGNQKAKKLIDQGKIGTPHTIRIRFAHSGPTNGWAMSNWFYAPNKAGGGALFDMGIHAIDLASSFFGPIAKVNGMVSTLEKKIEVEDTAILQFEFSSGALGYAEVGWTSRQGFFGVEIHGSEAAIVIDYLGEAVMLQGKSTASGKRSVKRRVIDKTPMVGGWDVELDYFVKHVRQGTQPDMGIDAGIDALAIALAAYDSSTRGKTVVIR